VFVGPSAAERFWNGYNQAVDEGWGEQFVAQCRRAGDYVPPIFRIAPAAVRSVRKNSRPVADTDRPALASSAREALHTCGS